MNKKTSLRLRKVCTNPDGTFNEGRYNALKESWKKVPAPARRGLLEALYRSVGKTLDA